MISNVGSPPRVRGTAALCPDKDLRNRITPARAGNRVILPDLEQVDRDHPRACGEQLEEVPEKLWAWGSPPRVRGTESQRHLFQTR